jgi:hypothetical protein
MPKGPRKPPTVLLRMKVSPNLYSYLEVLARETQLGAGPNDVAEYVLTQRLEQMLDDKYHEKKIPK